MRSKKKNMSERWRRTGRKLRAAINGRRSFFYCGILSELSVICKGGGSSYRNMFFSGHEFSSQVEKITVFQSRGGGLMDFFVWKISHSILTIIQRKMLRNWFVWKTLLTLCTKKILNYRIKPNMYVCVHTASVFMILHVARKILVWVSDPLWRKSSVGRNREKSEDSSFPLEIETSKIASFFSWHLMPFLRFLQLFSTTFNNSVTILSLNIFTRFF